MMLKEIMDNKSEYFLIVFTKVMEKNTIRLIQTTNKHYVTKTTWVFFYSPSAIFQFSIYIFLATFFFFFNSYF